MQTGFRNGVEMVLGKGGQVNGTFTRTCMQMLHGAYNLQNWSENEEMVEVWEHVEQEKDEALRLKFKRLEEPVLSRWWLVGACALSFKACLETWKRICRAIRNATPAASAFNKIASCTLSLMGERNVINDLEIMVAFHESFMFPHFKFFQQGDPQTGKTPGFQCRHMLVRYYLMLNDLDKIQNGGWRTHDKFQDFVKHLETFDEGVDKDKQIEKSYSF